MASASSILPVDQKQDLKNLLECSICLETFEDPRTLPCLHSFCKSCLENFVDGKREDELNCPVCRSNFTLNEKGVAGMTKNHFICNMIEALSIQDQDKCIPCSHCEQPSVGRCVTCELFMCNECLRAHNEYRGFNNHVVLTMKELSQPENRSKIKGKSYCKKHPSKKLKLYCETCEELICTYCVVFEHVRLDHVCSPLEEIAERKRGKLKTICQTLESNKSHSSKIYNHLAMTSMCLDRNLEDLKNHIYERKNNVLAFVNSVLEKKVQSLITQTENTAKIKNRTIDEELKRISDYEAGQRKAYDLTKALLVNGSNEEIMLSYKSVQQSVEKNEKEYEQKDIDYNLTQYNDEELDKIFHDEIKASMKGTRQGKIVNRQNQMWNRFSQSRLVFDAQTGKLVTSKAYNLDNMIVLSPASYVCGPE